MPVITVKGISQGDLSMRTFQEKLKKFSEELAAQTSNYMPLELQTKDVFFSFPRDLRTYDVPNEIIITVDGLFLKPLRTEEVRKNLARILTSCGKRYFEDAKVECFVHSFDSSDGFYVREASEKYNPDFY